MVNFYRKEMTNMNKEDVIMVSFAIGFALTVTGVVKMFPETDAVHLSVKELHLSSPATNESHKDFTTCLVEHLDTLTCLRKV